MKCRWNATIISRLLKHKFMGNRTNPKSRWDRNIPISVRLIFHLVDSKFEPFKLRYSKFIIPGCFRPVICLQSCKNLIQVWGVIGNFSQDLFVWIVIVLNSVIEDLVCFLGLHNHIWSLKIFVRLFQWWSSWNKLWGLFWSREIICTEIGVFLSRLD